MRKYGILIIDDDESTHEVLGEYLELSGFDVSHARDGALGIELMKELSPDLVLLDVNMPVLDGFRTMEIISKQTGLKDTPVLFLTSLDRYNLKIKGLEMGAEDYIVKPYNKAEVLARVKSALRRSERYKRTDGTMEGDLANMSLVEILQALDIGRKTACIHIKEQAGLICVESGSIILARWRDFIGKDALQRLFFLEKGAFSVTFGPPEKDEAREPASIQRTLFEAVAYVDELKSMISGRYSVNNLIEIKDAQTPFIGKYRNMSPVKLCELIAVMEGDPKENVNKIIEALEKKQAVIVS